MPEPAQQKNDTRIAKRRCLAPPVPSQRNINIVAKPGVQRNMPPAPKLAYVARKKAWTVRKLISQRVALWERVDICDKPGQVDTKIISTIVPPDAGQSQVNVTVIAASEEGETIDGTTGRCLKIEHEGKTGWLFGGRASIERGGPQYYLPAAIIDFRLGGEY